MELKFQKLEYHVRKTPFLTAFTHPHYLPSKKKTLTTHCTLHAFLTLLSKVLEREITQIKLAVVLDMWQRPHVLNLGRVFHAAIGPGLGPRLKKCGLRPTRPIVARFRPLYKTRPKAKWGLGRIFLPYGRVLKTRPQNLFFVVPA